MTREEFSRQFALFKEQSKSDGRFSVIEDSHQILDDDKPAHDEKDFSFDYWAHCSWAARKVADRRPQTHVDFGSYIYFAGLVSAFVDHFVYADIRQMPEVFRSLRYAHESLTSIGWESESLLSVSCLHTLEHVGLGRYGDTLDAQGDLKAARELSRILAPGGQLLIVLPMNEKPRVQFNGERMYSALQVHEMFKPLKMIDHACIFNGALVENMTAPQGVNYTGCIVFTKEKAISA